MILSVHVVSKVIHVVAYHKNSIVQVKGLSPSKVEGLTIFPVLADTVHKICQIPQ